MKVWDIRRGYATHVFKGSNDLISALHFFELNVAKDEEKTSISVQSLQRQRKSDISDDAHTSTSIKFRLAAGSQDGKVRIWDLHKKNCTSILESHVSDVTCLDYSSDLNILLTASRDKTITWWDAKTWKSSKVVPILEEVECAGFLEQGRYTYTGGKNGNIRVWETKERHEITRPQLTKKENDAIVKSLTLKDFVLSVHSDHTLKLHSVNPLKDLKSTDMIPPLPVIRKISGTHDEVIDLAYLMPDKSLMALATNSEEIRIVSMREGSTENQSYFGADVAQLEGHEDIIICLDTDWSGHWIATGAKDNTARIWKIDAMNSSFTCYCVLSGHAESLGAIGLSRETPPETSLAFKQPLEHPPPFVITGSQDQTVKKWLISKNETGTFQKLPRAAFTRKAHDKDINAIDVNYNSQLFASASQDKTVKIWDVEEGEVQGVLRGHKRGVWSVKFAPQDIPNIKGHNDRVSGKHMILTGSGDKTIKIWSLVDYSCLRTFESHSNSVLKVCWLTLPESENRKKYVQLASAGGDGLVKVWDVQTGEVACTLDNHEDRVWALAINPSTNMIVSGSADATVTFWRDTSSMTQAVSIAAVTQLIEQEQEFENYVYSKSYREAITLALQLNHPGRLLSLFQSVVGATPETDSLCGLKSVDAVLKSLSDEQLHLLLLRLRDWNTNVRTASVAQKILWSILKTYPSSRLSNLKCEGDFRDRGGDNSLKEIWNALKVYSEKHFKKVEELNDASYLIEYTLRCMDGLDTPKESETNVGNHSALDFEGDLVIL